MADFKTALAPTLEREGGWVNVDGDSGEETYRGISKANFPTWMGWPLVAAAKPKTGQIINSPVLESMVAEFYRHNFWLVIRGDEVINQEVASDLFDKAVNMGTHQAIVLSQRSLEIEETGHMDDVTLAKLNEMNPYA